MSASSININDFDINDFFNNNNNNLNDLNKEYNNILINKIKENFNDDDQKLFIMSFYMYLNYNSNEYCINYEDIYKWLGYDRYNNSKRIIFKNFIENKDYIIVKKYDKEKKDLTIKAAAQTRVAAFYEEKSAPQTGGAGFYEENRELSIIFNNEKNLGGSGLNKELIFLTINTFKKLCMLSQTKKHLL